MTAPSNEAEYEDDERRKRKLPFCRTTTSRRSGGAEQPQLGQGGDPVIQVDLLDDPAALEFEDGDASEVHLPARVGGQAASKKVREGRTSVSATTLPLADDIVAFGDEIGRAPEVEIGKRSAEISHEGLDVVAPLPRLVERVFQQHVRRGNFVDHTQVAGSALEVSEPAADNSL